MYFVSDTAKVELKVDECKPLPSALSRRRLYCGDAATRTTLQVLNDPDPMTGPMPSCPNDSPAC